MLQLMKQTKLSWMLMVMHSMLERSFGIRFGLMMQSYFGLRTRVRMYLLLCQEMKSLIFDLPNKE